MTNIFRDDLAKTLNSDENAGYIIRDIANLECNLDLLLTRFFTAQERFEEFENVIMSRFTFFEKKS